MASRADIKAALAALRGAPGMGDYVRTLRSKREDVISRLVAPLTPRSQWVELIAEIRVYDNLLRDIDNN